jgi:hypothetical protein
MMRAVEGAYEGGYRDGRGISTTGIGFNLRDDNVRDAGLTQFGFNQKNAAAVAYAAGIETVVDASYSSVADLQSACRPR